MFINTSKRPLNLTEKHAHFWHVTGSSAKVTYFSKRRKKKLTINNWIYGASDPWSRTVHVLSIKIQIQLHVIISHALRDREVHVNSLHTSKLCPDMKDIHRIFTEGEKRNIWWFVTHGITWIVPYKQRLFLQWSRVSKSECSLHKCDARVKILCKKVIKKRQN